MKTPKESKNISSGHPGRSTDNRLPVLNEIAQRYFDEGWYPLTAPVCSYLPHTETGGGVWGYGETWTQCIGRD